jgi:Tol biopolymer transport system component
VISKTTEAFMDFSNNLKVILVGIVSGVLSGIVSGVVVIFLNRLGYTLLAYTVFITYMCFIGVVCVFLVFQNRPLASFLPDTNRFFQPKLSGIPMEIGGIRFYTESRRLPFHGYDPGWSHCGKRFVYCTSARNHDGTELHIGDLSGFSETLLSTRSIKYAPSFSHDDRYVSFISDNKLYTVDTATNAPAKRISPKGYELATGAYAFNSAIRPNSNHYQWSPRENKILCGLRRYGESQTDVFLLDVKNPDNPINYTTDKMWMDLKLGIGDLYPKWSPSGKRIAFSFGKSGIFNLWIPDAGGRKLTLLSARDLIRKVRRSEDESAGFTKLRFEGRFDWLTDSEIVFSFGGDGKYSIGTYRLDGTFRNQTSRNYYFDPFPNPRGKKLVYFYGQKLAILSDYEGKHRFKLFEMFGPLREYKYGTQYAWQTRGNWFLAAVQGDLFIIRIPKSLRAYVNALRERTLSAKRETEKPRWNREVSEDETDAATPNAAAERKAMRNTLQVLEETDSSKNEKTETEEGDFLKDTLLDWDGRI